MNILGLIFSLLLLLSYGFYVSWDKHVASTHLRNTYVGHQKANRKLLNHYQSELYKNLRSQRSSPDHEEVFTTPTTPQTSVKPAPNRECAKINLRPLIQEGKEAHPLLYQLTAKMLRTFYAPLCKEKRFEYHLLDTLLAKAKEHSSLPLEKLSLNEWSRLYYKMLKGTKEWDLEQHTGYPSLLDYVKVENETQKICLFHAHPDLLFALFSPEIGQKLHEEIHRKEGPLLTKELIERICSEKHLIALDAELFNLLELGNPQHEETKKIFLAKDTTSGVSLRKAIYLDAPKK